MNKTAEKTTTKKAADKKLKSDEREAREPRPEKVALVEELKDFFQNSEGVVFTEYRGLDVSEMAELRNGLGEVGASYKIYKNTLVRRAVDDLKLKDLEEILVGPVGLAFVDKDADYSEIARALAAYKKLHEAFLIKGGFSDGQLMNADEFEAFAKLPPLAVLQAQFAGALKAPMSNFAGLLFAVLQKFAGQLAALKEKMEKEGAAPQAEAEADEAPEEKTSEKPTNEKEKENDES